MKKQKEIRNFNVEIRAEDEDGKPRLRGYAAVFDSNSSNLGGFVEKVDHGAFKRSLEDGDIRAFFNHNKDLILGRTKANTLTLQEDEHGLQFEIDLPDTSAGRDAKVSVERGDVDGVSFGFIVKQEEWDQRSKPPTRTLKEVDLIEISPCVFPAYTSTEVALRSAEEHSVFIEQDPAPDVVDHDQEEKPQDSVDRTFEFLQAQIDLLKL